VIRKKLNLALRFEKDRRRAHLSNLKARKAERRQAPALDGAILHAPLQNSAVTSAIEGADGSPGYGPLIG